MDRKTFKTIAVSLTNYDKMFQRGVGWKTSFNDILTDLLEKADAKEDE